MTTLQAIGFTVAGGSVVLSSCVLLFGMAVQRQLLPVAPRASARPPQVIYNPRAPIGHPQCRGNPFWGWIRWCHQLSYETLLKGVPGTGTRKGGTSGTMLHVTLDGIVLLRFHVLGRRISLLATILCCGLLLPLYTSAPCLPDFLASNKYMSLYECNATLTTFRQTTLSHVPDLQQDYSTRSYAAIMARMYVVVFSFWMVTLYAFYLLRQEWVELLALRRIHYLESTRGGEQQSSQEWTNRLQSQPRSDTQSPQKQYPFIERRRRRTDRQPLSSSTDALDANNSSSFRGGLRHEGCNDENEGTSYEDEDDNDNGDDIVPDGIHGEDNGGDNSSHHDNDDGEPHLTHRRPWIPHPEQPDTVPNVEPYSLLVGHLPFPTPPSIASMASSTSPGGSAVTAIPTLDNDDHDDDDGECDIDPETGSSTPSSTIDDECALPLSDIVRYQLRYVTQLLETALPQEPGYSSPIAAVTVVPPADSMGRCWRKWYAAASALRRLDFLQSVWDARRATPDAVTSSTSASSVMVSDPNAANTNSALSSGSHASSSTRLSMASPLPPLSQAPPSPRNRSTKSIPRLSPSSPRQIRNARKPHRNSSKYLFQVFGGHYNPALEDDIRASVASSSGPEQMAVFSRELAQSASNCCPHGMCEGRMRKLSDADLKDRITDAEMDLHRAVQDLQRARDDVASRVVSYRRKKRRRQRQRQPRSLFTVTAQHRLFHPTLQFLQRLRSRVAPADSAALEMTELTSEDSDRGVSARTASRSIDRGDNDAHSNGTKSNGSSSEHDSDGALPLRLVRPSRSFLRDREVWKELLEHVRRIGGLKSKFPDVLLRENSYAILTFTSRQAAAAARQYISSSRELSLHDIPIPPLADAAPCTLMPFRFVCRPVTVTAKDWQKNVRLYLILSWLGLMYIFYTIPLTWSTSQVDPDTIAWLFPDHSVISESLGVNVPELISGLASSIIWSFFFMMCPQVFKLIAYFGSRATSLAQAERRAMQYFWWFMVLTAFTGPMLAYWVLGAVNKSQRLGDGLREVLIRIAGTTPTLIAANWLNWIIYRFTIILPINFLLQFNTFLFSFLGLNCCSRLTIGGGPGGPVPYRIFVDSGVVLMCTFALAPSSPLVAPAAFAYFCVCEPLLKRNLIFVYRPRYDDGGLRWIVVFDMIISALVVGQILLSLQMGLKNALGPGLIATMAIPATIWFQWYCKRKFDPAFENTALLRTSLIDGWDSLDDMTLEHRESHLRFLVDAHKAAYVPVCIAGTDVARQITSEPAVAVPHSIIDSDSEHSEAPLKPRRQSSQGEARSRAPSSDVANAPQEDVDGADAGLGWLESALEPEDLVGAFGIFRLSSQKSE